MEPTPSIVDQTLVPESPLRYLQIRYNPYPDDFLEQLPPVQAPISLPKTHFTTCFHRLSVDTSKFLSFTYTFSACASSD